MYDHKLPPTNYLQPPHVFLLCAIVYPQMYIISRIPLSSLPSPN